MGGRAYDYYFLVISGLAGLCRCVFFFTDSPRSDMVSLVDTHVLAAIEKFCIIVA